MSVLVRWAMANLDEGSRATHVLLLQNDAATPLGCLRLAGAITQGRGVEPSSVMRVYGRYAVVCLLRGGGRYSDVQGIRRRVKAGDAILVFPEVGHVYGPSPSAHWDEIYLTFDGPVFDLWRHTGLLDTDHPVLPLPTKDWPDRLRELVTDAVFLATPQGRLEQVNRFLLLLGELLTPLEKTSHEGSVPEWVTRAQAAMDIDLGAEISLESVASSVGMAYETFRKRFLRATGVTPVRYRLRRRVAAACELLRYSPQMTNRQAAEILGFADEFHFSRRFTQVMGVTPRAFRQKIQ